MSTRRFARGQRALGISGTSRLARPPQRLPEPDIRPGFANPTGFGVDSHAAFFGPTDSFPLDDVAIGTTIGTPIFDGTSPWIYGYNLLLLLSDVAPDVPAGWSLTITTNDTTDGYRVYALEKAADTSDTVDITFPSPATGVILSYYSKDSAVVARGDTDLAAVSTLTVDLDRSTPGQPTTTLFGLLYMPAGTPDVNRSSWEPIASGGGPGTSNSDVAVWQQLREPPPTTWQDDGINSQTFYSWFFFEFGSS